MKSIGFFIIGALFGLTISELIKDKKPVVRHQDIYYRYAPRYPYGYDYYYRPLQYRSAIRTQSNTGNDEVVQSGGGNMEQGETHFNVRQVDDRVKRN